MIYKYVFFLAILDLLCFDGFNCALGCSLSGRYMGDRSSPEHPCYPGLGGSWILYAVGPLVWLGNSSIWIFGWIGCSTFNLLSGFIKIYVLKFSFWDFFFSFPFWTISCVCGMIAIEIGTFNLIVAILILMTCLSAFCTFLFIFAEFCCCGHTLENESIVGNLVCNFCASN